MPITIQRCPRCKQKDETDFSTCRFCGTKYSAIITKEKVRGLDTFDLGSFLRSKGGFFIFLVLVTLLKGPISYCFFYVCAGFHSPQEYIRQSMQKQVSK